MRHEEQKEGEKKRATENSNISVYISVQLRQAIGKRFSGKFPLLLPYNLKA
jgi:hypothetical protein